MQTTQVALEMRDTAHTAEIGLSERFHRFYLTHRQPEGFLVTSAGAGRHPWRHGPLDHRGTPRQGRDMPRSASCPTRPGDRRERDCCTSPLPYVPETPKAPVDPGLGITRSATAGRGFRRKTQSNASPRGSLPGCLSSPGAPCRRPRPTPRSLVRPALDRRLQHCGHQLM